MLIVYTLQTWCKDVFERPKNFNSHVYVKPKISLNVHLKFLKKHCSTNCIVSFILWSHTKTDYLLNVMLINCLCVNAIRARVRVLWVCYCFKSAHKHFDCWIHYALTIEWLHIEYVKCLALRNADAQYVCRTKLVCPQTAMCNNVCGHHLF